MVKFIPLELTLELRSKILRNGMPLTECKFLTDDTEGIFHLAAYHDEKIASVATFFPNQHKAQQEQGYQLRGMATDTPFAGKGFGKQLVQFAVQYIKTTKATYIWCNARGAATEFYKKLGFEIFSEEFEITGVGPHYEMILKI